ncbi:centriolar satellite-associated tubulin polyglutamylase complex regulator 1-like [Branchiostoma lanceolatum]|uniref:centriolar satellite-associated tubulin polyglutamylase complex regulator 1-like n=1 Tax=Branchiostoma lanceolatum TaxID=7740 RepID=UPI003453B8DC
MSGAQFSMSGEEYLARHHVITYLEDAVSQLLEHREENSRVNPAKFLSDYFTSVHRGNHTLFREYEYIKATPHNRTAFIRIFWKCFRQVGKSGDLLNAKEYQSLLCLLCPDFPLEVVQKTARIVLMDDAMDCLMSFTDFLFAFQLQFYYDEFLYTSSEIYTNIMSATRGSRDTVVVPTVSRAKGKTPQLSDGPDSVESAQFFEAVKMLCETFQFSHPPVDILRGILMSAPRVSFYGFLMALAKHEGINSAVGILPPKGQILDDTDPDIQISSARTPRPVSAVPKPAS